MDYRMKPQFAQLSLAAGGSHYPTINPQLQQLFGELIVQKVLSVVDSAPDSASPAEIRQMIANEFA